MATYKIPEAFLITVPAGTDLLTPNLLVKIASGAAALAGGDEKAIGVIVEGAKAGEPVTVQIGGVAKVVASGAISAGAVVASAGSGKVKGGTTNPVGVAIETATADGNIIAVALGV